jgi:drug/metabolite transporter (DMT)-like permease
MISESCNTLGQIFFKKSANRLAEPSLKGLGAYTRFLGDVFRVPYIWIGLGLMGAGLVVWMMALTCADLSFVYPVGSMQYIFVLVFSHFLLGEKIDRMKLIGTLLVVCGITCIGLS